MRSCTEYLHNESGFNDETLPALGKVRRNSPMETWGQILGEGVLHAFSRLEHVESSSRLRSASLKDGFVPKMGLDIQNVSVQRSGNLILEGVNLRIQSGEWLLLCGPSGAGKSTLLRLIAGLEEPIDGQMIRLSMSISSGIPMSKRLDGHIAFLMQNPEHHFLIRLEKTSCGG